MMALLDSALCTPAECISLRTHIGGQKSMYTGKGMEVPTSQDFDLEFKYLSGRHRVIFQKHHWIGSQSSEHIDTY